MELTARCVFRAVEAAPGRWLKWIFIQESQLSPWSPGARAGRQPPALSAPGFLSQPTSWGAPAHCPPGLRHLQARPTALLRLQFLLSRTQGAPSETHRRPTSPPACSSGPFACCSFSGDKAPESGHLLVQPDLLGLGSRAAHAPPPASQGPGAGQVGRPRPHSLRTNRAHACVKPMFLPAKC